jgi:hypothetical protein
MSEVYVLRCGYQPKTGCMTLSSDTFADAQIMVAPGRIPAFVPYRIHRKMTRSVKKYLTTIEATESIKVSRASNMIITINLLMAITGAPVIMKVLPPAASLNQLLTWLLTASKENSALFSLGKRKIDKLIQHFQDKYGATANPEIEFLRWKIGGCDKRI